MALFGNRRAFTAASGQIGSPASASTTAARLSESDSWLPTRVVLDTDANNEVDDQFAIAYGLLHPRVDVVGLTVNATPGGGEIAHHLAEAHRVVDLCGRTGSLPIIEGAERRYADLRNTPLEELGPEGLAAGYLIDMWRSAGSTEPPTVIALGKLTNIALALDRYTGALSGVRVIWLGTNFPAAGEYNLGSDVGAANRVIATPIDLTIVPARYDNGTGAAAVVTSTNDVRSELTGRGPRLPTAIEGRAGGTFETFGDYAVDLFEIAESLDGRTSRALFDVATVALAIAPHWATVNQALLSRYQFGQWTHTPGEEHSVKLATDFAAQSIITDLFQTVQWAEANPITASD